MKTEEIEQFLEANKSRQSVFSKWILPLSLFALIIGLGFFAYDNYNKAKERAETIKLREQSIKIQQQSIDSLDKANSVMLETLSILERIKENAKQDSIRISQLIQSNDSLKVLSEVASKSNEQLEQKLSVVVRDFKKVNDLLSSQNISQNKKQITDLNSGINNKLNSINTDLEKQRQQQQIQQQQIQQQTSSLQKQQEQQQLQQQQQQIQQQQIQQQQKQIQQQQQQQIQIQQEWKYKKK